MWSVVDGIGEMGVIGWAGVRCNGWLVGLQAGWVLTDGEAWDIFWDG